MFVQHLQKNLPNTTQIDLNKLLNIMETESDVLAPQRETLHPCENIFRNESISFHLLHVVFLMELVLIILLIFNTDLAIKNLFLSFHFTFQHYSSEEH